MVGVPPVSLYLSLSLIRSLFLSLLLSPSVCARETYNGRREPTCCAPRVLIVLNFPVLICRLRDAHEKKKKKNARSAAVVPFGASPFDSVLRWTPASSWRIVIAYAPRRKHSGCRHATDCIRTHYIVGTRLLNLRQDFDDNWGERCERQYCASVNIHSAPPEIEVSFFRPVHSCPLVLLCILCISLAWGR